MSRIAASSAAPRSAFRPSTRHWANLKFWSTKHGCPRRGSVAGSTRCRIASIPVTSMPTPSWLVVLALAAAGYGLTLYVFFPGVMTYDAKYIYEAIPDRQPGDWQSPLMGALWRWIDPLAPGAASMFLFIVTIYWSAFVLLALTIARRSLPLAAILLVLAALPPAFTLVGVIWRDILFAGGWLLAAVLAWSVREWALPARVPVQMLALCLTAFGILLRPNALFAIPILAIYILWPAAFRLKRAALLYLPLAAAFYAL